MNQSHIGTVVVKAWIKWFVFWKTKIKWRLMFRAKFFRWIKWPSNLPSSNNTFIFLDFHTPEVSRFSHSFDLGKAVLPFPWNPWSSLVWWFLPRLFLRQTKPTQPPRELSVISIRISPCIYSCSGHSFRIVSTTKWSIFPFFCQLSV